MQKSLIIEQTFGFLKGGIYVHQGGHTKRISRRTNNKTLSSLLNQLGREGWRVMTCYQAPNIVTARGTVTIIMSKLVKSPNGKKPMFLTEAQMKSKHTG